MWCGLVRALARDRPVVWIAEDLQFAGQEDRGVLRAMLRATARDRVLLLASTRAPLPAGELAELARSDGFHRVALRRLDCTAVQRLLHDAFRNKELAVATFRWKRGGDCRIMCDLVGLRSFTLKMR